MVKGDKKRVIIVAGFVLPYLWWGLIKFKRVTLWVHITH